MLGDYCGCQRSQEQPADPQEEERAEPHPRAEPTRALLCFALLCFVCSRSDFLLHYNTDTFILRADTAEARPAELYCVFVCAIDHS